MTEQQKILKILQLINLLKQPLGWTVDGLAEKFETTKRTIYRYLNLLTEVGFEIDTSVNGNRKFICDYSAEQHHGDFTLEEAELLRDLVITGTTNQALRSTILQKLYINSELGPLAVDLINGHINLMKTKLAKAMKEERQVVLKNYHSISSQEIKDYRVEPFHFTENYASILAFDIHSGIVKQFKLSRMNDVILLQDMFAHKEKHLVKNRDVFNFTGDRIFHVKLKLSFQAFLLLRENYPRTIPYLVKTENNEYFFNGQVYQLTGVGRFVLGYLDEVVVLDPPELRQFIEEKLTKYRNPLEREIMEGKSESYEPIPNVQNIEEE